MAKFKHFLKGSLEIFGMYRSFKRVHKIVMLSSQFFFRKNLILMDRNHQKEEKYENFL
jgi:hypothetical protein